MYSSSDPPLWLWRLHRWIAGLLPTPQQRRGIAVLIVVLVLLLTHGALTLPFTVGWHASEALVQDQEDLRRLRSETGECNAAAAFLRTAEGKAYARKLMYNQLEDGERRIILKPEDSGKAPSTTQRVKGWMDEGLGNSGRSLRHTGEVLDRWALDPMKSDATAQPAPAPTKPHQAVRHPADQPEEQH